MIMPEVAAVCEIGDGKASSISLALFGTISSRDHTLRKRAVKGSARLRLPTTLSSLSRPIGALAPHSPSRTRPALEDVGCVSVTAEAVRLWRAVVHPWLKTVSAQGSVPARRTSVSPRVEPANFATWK